MIVAYDNWVNWEKEKLVEVNRTVVYIAPKMESFKYMVSYVM